MKLFFNLLMTVSPATGQFIVSINKASLPSLQKRPASSKPVDLPAAGRSADGGLFGEGVQFAIGKEKEIFDIPYTRRRK